jgi:hypothetical protein
MKNLTRNLIIAAAVLMMTTALSAQTLKADIPFAFYVTGKVMPAGSYTVDFRNLLASGLVPMRATQTGESAIAVRSALADAKEQWKEDGKARLVFSCSDTCTLMQMYLPGDSEVYNLAHPKFNSVGARIAVIVMRTDKGD